MLFFMDTKLFFFFYADANPSLLRSFVKDNHLMWDEDRKNLRPREMPKDWWAELWITKNEKIAGTKEKRYKPGVIFMSASDWSL